jgi:hypothetical protein
MALFGPENVRSLLILIGYETAQVISGPLV